MHASIEKALTSKQARDAEAAIPYAVIEKDWVSFCLLWLIAKGPVKYVDYAKLPLWLGATPGVDLDAVIEAWRLIVNNEHVKPVHFGKDWMDIALRPVAARSEAELKEFVLGVLRGQIFTSHELPENDMRLLGFVFMPLLFGGLENVDVTTLGTIWEWTSKAAPRAINGYPTFFSCRLMNREDWQRCLTAIWREQDRDREIEI